MSPPVEQLVESSCRPCRPLVIALSDTDVGGRIGIYYVREYDCRIGFARETRRVSVGW